MHGLTTWGLDLQDSTVSPVHCWICRISQLLFYITYLPMSMNCLSSVYLSMKWAIFVSVQAEPFCKVREPDSPEILPCTWLWQLANCRTWVCLRWWSQWWVCSIYVRNIHGVSSLVETNHGRHPLTVIYALATISCDRVSGLFILAMESALWASTWTDLWTRPCWWWLPLQFWVARWLGRYAIQDVSRLGLTPVSTCLWPFIDVVQPCETMPFMLAPSSEPLAHKRYSLANVCLLFKSFNVLFVQAMLALFCLWSSRNDHIVSNNELVSSIHSADQAAVMS